MPGQNKDIKDANGGSFLLYSRAPLIIQEIIGRIIACPFSGWWRTNKAGKRTYEIEYSSIDDYTFKN